MEDILKEELKLDRDDRRGRAARGGKNQLDGEPVRISAREPASGSMTKREIIEELLSRRRRITHRESETIVNAMFDAMATH